MKLIDLDASLLRIEAKKEGEDYAFTYSMGVSLADAHGIMFLCPKCYQKNGGPQGTHSIICWFENRGVPPDLSPKPGRWNPSGTGIDDLTFVGPGAASVQLTGGCEWHGYIKQGQAIDA